MEDAKFLIKKYAIVGKTQTEIESVLGKANTNEQFSGKTYLTYIIGGACDLSGRFDPRVDWCYMQLVLIDGKAAGTSYSCT